MSDGINQLYTVGNKDPKTINPSRLYGKKMLVIGDSFVAGNVGLDNMWCAKIAERNAMTLYNKGVGGASVAYEPNQQLTSIVQNIDNIISTVPNTDYIVFLAGHNDGSTVMHTSRIPIGEVTDAENTTFCGALNIIVGKLLAAYPTARILFCGPFHRRDDGSDVDYGDAMQKVVSQYSIPYFDNYRRSGLSFQVASIAEQYEESTPWHLNEAGQERYSYVVENQMLLL